MAPTSARFTTVAASIGIDSWPQGPMTTTEKHTAVKAKSNAKQKPRSLPPPGENIRVTKPRSSKKKSTRPAKPMTTKEKAKKAGEVKRAKDRALAKKQEKTGGRDGAKAKRAKGPSFMSILSNQYPSTSNALFKRQGLGVLMRPTEKAKWFQRKLGMAVNQTTSQAPEQVQTEVFRVMDLPKELRVMIWKLSVVDTDFLVCPDLPTGCQQPDLAMVNKQVRREVLPVYYEQNIFGVNLVEAQKAQKRRLTGLPAIEKWSSRLEERGWFEMIRKWAFIYIPKPAVVPKNGVNGDDGSLIVTVNFVKRDGGFWNVDTGGVQVHHDAQCILPGAVEYDQCIIRKSPKWLNDLVEKVTFAAKGQGISGRMIVNLAREVSKRADSLVEIRCDKTTVYRT